MRTRIVFSWNRDQAPVPLSNIVFDSYPAFDIIIFDYTGSGKTGEIQSVALRKNGIDYCCQLVSARTECKGDILNVMANVLARDICDSDYVAFVDDDILIRVSCINSSINTGAAHGFSAFQPSLAKCSYYTHAFTLQQQGNGVRMVDWVEVMMPFVRADLFFAAAGFYEHSISSYGIDCYVWPVVSIVQGLGSGYAVLDNVVAAHLRPITSGRRVFRNGMTGLQEMRAIRGKVINYIHQESPGCLQSPRIKALLAFRI